jgi:hypothetical protein
MVILEVVMESNNKTSPLESESTKETSGGWIWPSITSYFIFRYVGIVGGIVVLVSYYLIKPKLGTWGAVAVSTILAIVAVMLATTLIRGMM